MLPKLKLRQNTEVQTPVFQKSSTVQSSTPSHIKVIKGKFSESSLKSKVDKKVAIDERQKISIRETEPNSTALPQKHLIQAFDASVSKYT